MRRAFESAPGRAVHRSTCLPRPHGGPLRPGGGGVGGGGDRPWATALPRCVESRTSDHQRTTRSHERHRSRRCVPPCVWLSSSGPASARPPRHWGGHRVVERQAVARAASVPAARGFPPPSHPTTHTSNQTLWAPLLQAPQPSPRRVGLGFRGDECWHLRGYDVTVLSGIT